MDRLENRAGFGLPEVLTALVILTTALLALAATAARVGEVSSSAQRGTQAMSIARVQLETLIAQPYDSVDAGSTAVSGVQMDWTVDTMTRMKEVVLVYRYEAPGKTRTDTLTAAVLDRS